MELDGNQGSKQDAGSGLPQGSPLLPVLFVLTCGRILKELPEGCSYVDDCQIWSEEYESMILSNDKTPMHTESQREFRFIIYTINLTKYIFCAPAQAFHCLLIIFIIT
jgi:hypothetical protein